MRTRIKICGITDRFVAEAAAAAGADAIGMVFHPPSSRNLGWGDAMLVSAWTPPFVARVAVMVNPSAEFVREMIERIAPSCLQFHGEEDEEFCLSFGLPYIKALRMTPGVDLSDFQMMHTLARGYLLDAHQPGQYGGGGVAFDWSLAGDTIWATPLILAGGLDADNVVEAIAQVTAITGSPLYGVDVSSGVETDGVKDIAKIERFCRAVRRYDAHFNL